MKSFWRGLAAAVLAGVLALPVHAGDQLFIRNHPFKGAVVHNGKALWVELQAFAKALDARLVKSPQGGYQLSRAEVPAADVPGGKVAIGDTLLDTQEVNGQTLISLDDSAGSLGLKVINNRGLGTIDVNFAVPTIHQAPPPPPPVAASKEPPPNAGATKGKKKPGPAKAVKVAWLTSYDEAVKQSERTGKPIMMDFTGSDWCGYCIALKSSVFDTAEFQSWSQKRVILLEVDFPHSPQAANLKAQNEALAQKYGIQGYPTIIYIDAKGNVLGQQGYEEGGPAAYTQNAEKMLSKK